MTTAAQKKAAEKAAAEQKAADDKAAAESATGQSKPEPKDVADKTADPNIEGVATTAEAQNQREERGESNPAEVSDHSGVPEEQQGGLTVQSQREDEAKASALRTAQYRGEADAEGNPIERSDEEQALLDAAPGGQRTLLTGGTEGSTKVKDTAAYPGPPLAGPLHDPVNDITNLDARDDDPDNRVYGDEAGPRFEETSVETQTRIVGPNGEAPNTQFVDADGNALSFEDNFETHEGKTFSTTKVRIYETFVFPNTKTEGKRLAYVAGRKVPVGEVENVRRMLNGDA